MWEIRPVQGKSKKKYSPSFPNLALPAVLFNSAVLSDLKLKRKQIRNKKYKKQTILSDETGLYLMHGYHSLNLESKHVSLNISFCREVEVTLVTLVTLPTTKSFFLLLFQ